MASAGRALSWRLLGQHAELRHSLCARRAVGGEDGVLESLGLS